MYLKITIKTFHTINNAIDPDMKSEDLALTAAMTVAQYVELFLLDEGGLYGKSEIFGPKEVLPVVSISDIKIPLWEVFEVEAPEEKAQGDQKQESNS